MNDRTKQARYILEGDRLLEIAKAAILVRPINTSKEACVGLWRVTDCQGVISQALLRKAAISTDK